MMKKTTLIVTLVLMMFLSSINVAAQAYVQTQLNTPTVKNMLANAMLPIGKTLYVYGGAWNESDEGAGVEARRYGVSAKWENCYNSQNSNYDYKKTRYQIHDGLDCTGYVGWTIYQIFGKKYNTMCYNKKPLNNRQKIC